MPIFYWLILAVILHRSLKQRLVRSPLLVLMKSHQALRRNIKKN